MVVQPYHHKLDARREALGMSKPDVARLAHVSLATVNRVLLGRDEGASIRSIQAIAAALHVTIRIGTTISVDETIDAFEVKKQRAEVKARWLVGLMQGTMALESQGVEPGFIEQQVEVTKCRLLAGSSRNLWAA